MYEMFPSTPLKDRNQIVQQRWALQQKVAKAIAHKRCSVAGLLPSKTQVKPSCQEAHRLRAGKHFSPVDHLVCDCALERAKRARVRPLPSPTSDAHWITVCTSLLNSISNKEESFSKDPPSSRPTPCPPPATHTTQNREAKGLPVDAAEVAHMEEVMQDDADSDASDIVCANCFSGETTEDNDILICDGDHSKPMGYHQKCCEPPVINIPDHAWFCPECAIQRSDVDSRLQDSDHAPSVHAASSSATSTSTSTSSSSTDSDSDSSSSDSTSDGSSSRSDGSDSSDDSSDS